jgi:hypothetical protein
MFNVELGRFTRAVENDIFKALSQVCSTVDGEAVVSKGLNPLECGNLLRRKWEMFHDPVVVSLDASRFDQHVSVDALKAEHMVYLDIFSHDPQLKWLLDQQLETRGIFRGERTIRYSRKGGRCSGDMNTGLGNCILMIAMTASFVEERRIKYSIVDNGDDILLFLERRRLQDLAGIRQHFLDLGFKIKMESTHKSCNYGEDIGYTDCFERIQYCQTSPVAVRDGYLMVREPETSFSKDCLALCKPADFRKWIGAVGIGGTRAFGDIPVCSALYSVFEAHGDHSGNISSNNLYSDSGFSRMCRSSTARGSEIASFTRFSYFMAFGIAPSYQVILERRLHQGGIGQLRDKRGWYKPPGVGLFLCDPS